ncbi:hypothetical protein DRQ07_10975, partial [candidate division KSB1 bacterium]
MQDCVKRIYLTTYLIIFFTDFQKLSEYRFQEQINLFLQKIKLAYKLPSSNSLKFSGGARV